VKEISVDGFFVLRPRRRQPRPLEQTQKTQKKLKCNREAIKKLLSSFQQGHWMARDNFSNTEGEHIMKLTLGQQIAAARTRYGISQMKASTLVGQSQWWL
jgi:hypothetical protein